MELTELIAINVTRNIGLGVPRDLSLLPESNY